MISGGLLPVPENWQALVRVPPFIPSLLGIARPNPQVGGTGTGVLRVFPLPTLKFQVQHPAQILAFLDCSKLGTSQVWLDAVLCLVGLHVSGLE